MNQPASGIFADTVSAITYSAGFCGSSLRVPPAPESALTYVREMFVRYDAQDRFNGVRFRGDTVFPELKDCRSRLARFERMLEIFPKGYAAVPVLYVAPYLPIRQNARQEYRDLGCAAAFRRKVVTEHADELRENLRLPEKVIRNMRCHVDFMPKDGFGRAVALGVDHKIEIGGGGLWTSSSSTGVDPALAEAPPRRRINRIDNLEFTTDILHVFKNELHALQGLKYWRSGQSIPIVTMVQERDSSRSGLVSPLQPKGHPLAGVTLKEHFGLANRKTVPVSARYGDDFTRPPAPRHDTPRPK